MNAAQNIRLVNRLWLLLIGLTLFTAFMAEQDQQGAFSVLIIAIALGAKGRIIVDHYMELKTAHPLLRVLMRAYYYVIPVMIVVVYLYPDQIARWATLE